MFEIRKEEDLKAKLDKVHSAVSPLTQLLSMQSNEQNPFAHYLKFDAQVSSNCSTWSFLTGPCKFLLKPQDPRDQPGERISNLFAHVRLGDIDESVFLPVLSFAESHRYFSLQDG